MRNDKTPAFECSVHQMECGCVCLSPLTKGASRLHLEFLQVTESLDRREEEKSW